jgi:hypothetical protein
VSLLVLYKLVIGSHGFFIRRSARLPTLLDDIRASACLGGLLVHQRASLCEATHS